MCHRLGGLCAVGLGLCLLVLCELSSAEIHRAKVVTKSKQSSRMKNSYDAESAEVPMADEWTFLGHTQETWIFAMMSALLVGLSGIFPLLVIPLETGKALQKGASHNHLNMLLSFAVGGLLGDVFLHLLPEAWAHVKGHDHRAHTCIGLWIIVGMLAFFIIEKIFPENHGEEESHQQTQENTQLFSEAGAAEKNQQNGHTRMRKSSKNRNNNNVLSHVNGKAKSMVRNSDANTKNSDVIDKAKHIKTSGWLNLMANFIDNFTHGLAVAGSYCVDTKTGLITTAAILLHEIPHEIGDFAILLRAGFDRWRAAKAQLITAFGGLLGAVVALTAESAQKAGDSTAWILPFTSGGFIYIALVTVVPDLLKEENAWNSFRQVLLLCCGIGVMACVTLFF